MNIRVVKVGRQFTEDGRVAPPPCICPQPNCQHCNPGSGLPYCPFLIDVPVTDEPTRP